MSEHPQRDGRTPRRRSGGGSRKGRGNKKKVAFREALQAYCNERSIDPHYFMADLLADETLDDVHLKFQAARELAQYLQPKLRSIELKGNADEPIQHVMITTLGDALRRAYDPYNEPLG